MRVGPGSRMPAGPVFFLVSLHPHSALYRDFSEFHCRRQAQRTVAPGAEANATAELSKGAATEQARLEHSVGVALRLSEGVRTSGRDDENGCFGGVSRIAIGKEISRASQREQAADLRSLVVIKCTSQALQTQLLQGGDGANGSHVSPGCTMRQRATVHDQLLQWEGLRNSLQCI